MFIILIVVVVSQIYTYVKTYCFKCSIHCISLYLNKAVIKNEKNKHFIFQNKAQGRG